MTSWVVSVLPFEDKQRVKVLLSATLSWVKSPIWHEVASKSPTVWLLIVSDNTPSISSLTSNSYRFSV